MEITLPISSLVLIALGAVGVCISIIAGLTLILKEKAIERSNFIFALLLILSGFTLLNETLATAGIYNKFKNLYFIPLNFSLAIAPLFFLFIKSKYTRKISTLDYAHLLLPVIQFLVYVFVGFRSITFKSSLWKNDGFKLFLNIETILFSIGLILYSSLALYLLKKPNNEKYFWNEDVRKWLYKMVIVILIIAGLEMALFIGEFALSDRFPDLIYVLRSLLFVSLLLWIVYNAINLLYPRTIFKTLPKQNSSLLSASDLQQIKTKLKALIEEDKIFLNPDLSLAILSKYLDTSEKNCSKYFSTELKTNFNQYINSFRVKSFKENVRSGKFDNLTLLGIAFESGFDSKSTFNRVFKQMEGITPTAYKKSLSRP